MSDMKKLKVWLIIDEVNTSGGMERVVSCLAPHFAARFDFTVIGLRDIDNQSFYDFGSTQIRRVSAGRKNQRFPYTTALWRLFRQVMNEKPDVAIYFSMGRLTVAASTGILLTRYLRTKTIHIGSERIAYANHSRVVRLLKRASLRLYDAIIVPSKQEQTKLATLFKTPVYSVANPLPFSPAPHARTETTYRVALAAGHLTHRKGFDLLLTAWAEFVADHPNWNLRIVGEGEERENLEQKIVSLELTNNCELLGRHSNMEDIYDKADIFLLSSRYEGFGMVLVEAMSRGLPVISFACEAGPLDIITHGEDGYLIEPYDCFEYARAIRKVITSSAEYRRLSSNAITSSARFAPEAIADSWQYHITKTLK